MRRELTVALSLLALLAALPAAATTITINNVDAPGVGFNDPSPAAPVGGNPGTTLGAQRMFVFQTAASLWEAALDGVGATSGVPIVVQATFQPLFCTPTSATLGSAGTIQIFANFSGVHWPNTWHHGALANELAGFDLTPGPPDPGLLVPPFNDDIVAFFNGAINNDPNCLGGADWYYGIDNLPGANEIDLLNVVMHEFAHGLGFANFINEASGSATWGLADVYSVFSRDNTLGRQWNQMDHTERRFSAVNTGNLVWSGPTVSEEAPGVLSGIPVVRVNLPVSIAGDYDAQTASYGPMPTAAGVTAEVVLYDDGVGPDPHDGCDCPFGPPFCLNPAPLPTNLVGKIALIHRGSCNFSFKSAFAQLAGAVGVIISNNNPNGLPPMGGSELIPMTITSVGITEAAGDAIEGELPGVNATIIADQALGLAGADADGFVRLYAPNPVSPGSSVSHWDTVATPNLLMEPFINSDLAAATDLDLTPAQMKDVGWDGDPHCPVGSSTADEVVIDGCATGVDNHFGPWGFTLGQTTNIDHGNHSGAPAMGGCTIMDMIEACATMANSGQFTSCVAQVAAYLQGAGAISPSEKGAINTCAAAAD